MPPWSISRLTRLSLRRVAKRPQSTDLTNRKGGPRAPFSACPVVRRDLDRGSRWVDRVIEGVGRVGSDQDIGDHFRGTRGTGLAEEDEHGVPVVVQDRRRAVQI